MDKTSWTQLRWSSFITVLLLAFALGSARPAKAQISVAIGIGPVVAYPAPVVVYAPPVCPWGYYPYYPYGCAPYGYYGPDWFVSGVFIGAGPWFHGWYGHPWGWGYTSWGPPPPGWGWHPGWGRPPGWYGHPGWDRHDWGRHGWGDRPGWGRPNGWGPNSSGWHHGPGPGWNASNGAGMRANQWRNTNLSGYNNGIYGNRFHSPAMEGYRGSTGRPVFRSPYRGNPYNGYRGNDYGRIGYHGINTAGFHPYANGNAFRGYNHYQPMRGYEGGYQSMRGPSSFHSYQPRGKMGFHGAPQGGFHGGGFHGGFHGRPH